mmetsp:Transcript_7528/g.11397  ORF Transcript_7528/g.11397 Transcript_7528/m.11397 type:complete len:122 (+) Transcript_7528:437-802(+)
MDDDFDIDSLTKTNKKLKLIVVRNLTVVVGIFARNNVPTIGERVSMKVEHNSRAPDKKGVIVEYKNKLVGWVKNTTHKHPNNLKNVKEVLCNENYDVQHCIVTRASNVYHMLTEITYYEHR